MTSDPEQTSPAEHDAPKRARTEGLLRAGARHGPVARGLTNAIQLVTFVIIARALTPALFGRYATAFAIVTFLTMAGTLQLQIQVGRRPPGSDERTGPMAAVFGSTGGLLVTAAIGLVLGSYRTVLLAFTPYVVMMPFNALLRGRLQARGDATRLATAEVVQAVGKFGVVAGVLAAGRPLSLVVLALSDGAGILLAVLTLLTSTSVGARTSNSERAEASVAIRELVLRAWPLLVPPLMWVVINRADIVMLTAVIGEAVTGRYQVALRMTEILFDLYTSVLYLVVPALAQPFGIRDTREQLPSLLWPAYTLLLSALAFVAVFGDVIVRTAFGSAYLVDSAVYAILSAGTAAFVMGGLHWHVLVARRHDRLLAAMSVSMIVLNIALNALFIPFLGAVGAALGTGLSIGLSVALYAHGARRRERSSPYPEGSLRHFIGGAAAAIAILVGLRAVAGAALVAAVLAGVVATFGCGAVLWRWSRHRQQVST